MTRLLAQDHSAVGHLFALQCIQSLMPTWLGYFGALLSYVLQ